MKSIPYPQVVLCLSTFLCLIPVVLVRGQDATVENAFEAEAGQQVKRIELKHAKANDVVGVVRGVYRDVKKPVQASRNGPVARSRPHVSITADPATNSLVIRGPAAIVQNVEILSQTLDEDAAIKVKLNDLGVLTAADFKVFPLKNADATQAVETLTQLMDGPDLGFNRVRFSVDVRTNAIIAVGPKESLEIVYALLLTMDQNQNESNLDVKPLRTFRTRDLSAKELAKTLDVITSGENIEWSIADTDQILVKGNPAGLDRFEENLKVAGLLVDAKAPRGELAQPVFKIRLAWLVDPELAGDKAPKELPESLRAVVGEIQKTLGVEDLRLVAQTILSAGAGTSTQPRHISSVGTAMINGKTALLGFDADVSTLEQPMQIEIRATRSDDEMIGLIHTSIVAKPGHSVVLGATPINSKESVFIIEFLPEPTPSGKERSIEERLRTPVSLKFEKSTLKEVMDHLSHVSDIDFGYDTRRLAGVSNSEPISIRVEGITVAGALKLILEPLQLDFVIEDKLVRIRRQSP